MRAFIHVVGEADIGLDSSAYKEVGYGQARREAVESWRRRAFEIIDDRPTLAEFLGTSHELDSAGRLVLARRRRVPPLVSLLRAVDPHDEVELVLLGTTNDQGVPSLMVAETLQTVFERHGRLLGPEVVVRICRPKFDLDDVAEAVRETMMEDEPADAPPVEILWGPGSTEICLGVVAGIIATGRPWLLRRVRVQPPSVAAPLPEPTFDEVPVLADPAYPAVVSWLLRYGYPDGVPDALDRVDLDAPELRSIADAAGAPLRRVAAGNADSETLATWVHTDVRRLNRTSGLAVRAWITAEYRRRCRSERVPDATRVLGRVNIVELGKVIDAINRPPTRLEESVKAALARVAGSDSGRWLVGLKDLNNRAGDSAHQFKRLNPTSLRILQAEIGPQGGVPSGTDCGPFHLPTGVVAYLWAEGRISQTGREPVITTVLKHPPPPELLGLVPRRIVPKYTPHTYADLFLVSSRDALPFARQQAQLAADNAQNTRSPYQFALPVTLEQVEFKDPDGTVLNDAEAAAHDAADRWLRARNVDSVVVVPSGPKEQVTGLLSAALEYGHRRAVPVFVQALTTSQADEGTRFHRFLPYLSTNATVLELARTSLADLAFDTAVALLTLCRAPDRTTAATLGDLVVQLRELRDAFFAANKVAARERVMLCAELANRADTVRRIRLVHVAAQLYHQHGPKPRDAAGDQLNWVRNRLGVNHGGHSFDRAMRMVATRLEAQNLTPAALILRAAQEMTATTAADSAPIRRYGVIVSTLEQLIEQARAAQNRPVTVARTTS